MPRQANGTYVPPANTAAVSGQTISSTAFNTLETDIGTEITNSIDRAGRSAPTTDIPWGGKKITGLGTPSVSTDAANKGYVDTQAAAIVQSNAPRIGVTGGTADVITATFTPTITALTNGLTVDVRATAANATTTPSFTGDATATKTIVKGAGSALAVGNIPGAGYWMSLTYDSSLDKWVLNNPAIVQPASPIPGGFKNLSIKVASNTTVTVAADFVTVTNGTNYQTVPVSSTVNMGTTGVDALIGGTGANGTITQATWYYAWVISQANGTTKVVMAASSTADATFLANLANVASGVYTYYARIGAVRTASGSAQLLGTWQFGRRAQYVVGLAQTSVLPIITSGVGGTFGNLTNTWSTPSITSVVPSTASIIDVVVTGNHSGGANADTQVAPSTQYSGSYGSNPPPLTSRGASSTVVVVRGSMTIETTTIAYVANATGGGAYCAGWEDNI